MRTTPSPSQGAGEAVAETEGEATGEAVAEALAEAVADAPGEADEEGEGLLVSGPVVSGVGAGDVLGSGLTESTGGS